MLILGIVSNLFMICIIASILQNLINQCTKRECVKCESIELKRTLCHKCEIDHNKDNFGDVLRKIHQKKVM
jgi:hypothetical protein